MLAFLQINNLPQRRRDEAEQRRIIVQVRRMRQARLGLYLIAALWMLIVLPASGFSAPYAAHVIDARTGEVLFTENANSRLHPASLTKMMTLYIAFEAVRNGEISLDDTVKISSHAASEPPSKLGLRSGQKIKFRYLIRAAAVKSANDAATAIGEAIAGSEANFAKRMNRTAKALGMTRTTFRNAHGLTAEGHLSTAQDMTQLGRHLLYDFPEYYNLFSRTTADAGIKTVPNTNRRLLSSYKGADGIKTGYTRAAGFNLVASAQRGNERIIATVFGGKSSVSRNAKVAELLDLGFRRAPSRAPVRKPDAPQYIAEGPKVITGNQTNPGVAGKTIRVTGLVAASLRPVARANPAKATETLLAAVQEDSAELAALITETVSDIDSPAGTVAEVVTDIDAPAEAVAEAVASTATAVSSQAATVLEAATRPEARPEELMIAAVESRNRAEPEVVTRLSTSGGRHWGINVGRYTTRYQAEKVLLRTALSEMSTLDGSLRKVVQTPKGFDATFSGLSREGADLACRRLAARNVTCFTVGPS